MAERFLQKTDGDPYLYAWTEALSKRKDMREAAAESPAPVETEADPDGDDGDELDAIKTVAGLRDFAAANGVELPPEAKSKAEIRTAIRDALIGPDDPLTGQ